MLVAATNLNIVISDDDGWATAQIRQQFDVLWKAGHNVRVAAMFEAMALIRPDFSHIGGVVRSSPQPVEQELAVQDPHSSH